MNKVGKVWTRLILPAAIIVLWYLATTFGTMPASILPDLRMVGSAFGEMIAAGQLQEDLLISLGRVIKGKPGTVEQPFENLIESGLAKKFVDCSRKLSSKCRECAWYSLCRGGCRRWREGASSADNLNVLCPAYEIFFEHVWERLKKLGKYIERRYGVGPACRV